VPWEELKRQANQRLTPFQVSNAHIFWSFSSCRPLLLLPLFDPLLTTSLPSSLPPSFPPSLRARDTEARPSRKALSPFSMPPHAPFLLEPGSYLHLSIHVPFRPGRLSTIHFPSFLSLTRASFSGFLH
jgi:hypothetical protein